MCELTRGEFIEQISALERRLNERLDLLERLVALGFDDTADQIRLRFGELDIVRERSLLVTRRAAPEVSRGT